MKSPNENVANDAVRSFGKSPEPIDHLLSRWAAQGRDIAVSPDQAFAAADAALAEARHVPATHRRWLPG
ncbi:MAG: hypothetical protein WA979_12260, partial [Pacificimonas sp.]